MLRDVSPLISWKRDSTRKEKITVARHWLRQIWFSFFLIFFSFYFATDTVRKWQTYVTEPRFMQSVLLSEHSVLANVNQGNWKLIISWSWRDAIKRQRKKRLAMSRRRRNALLKIAQKCEKVWGQSYDDYATVNRCLFKTFVTETVGKCIADSLSRRCTILLFFSLIVAACILAEKKKFQHRDSQCSILFNITNCLLRKCRSFCWE